MRALFLWVGRAEGLSYLLLLGVAMPLKYVAGHPEATLVAGWAHGLLFVSYVAALAVIAARERWPLARIGLGFVASLVPFGPFLFERRLDG